MKQDIFPSISQQQQQQQQCSLMDDDEFTVWKRDKKKKIQCNTPIYIYIMLCSIPIYRSCTPLS